MSKSIFTILSGLILIIWYCSALACPVENKDCVQDKKTWITNISSFESQTKTIIPPLPVYKSSINLGSNFEVVRLAYSPDGRYLAIGDAGSSTIVIWDVDQNREQARIHTRSNGGQPTWPSKWLHWNPGYEIHWSPDGRFITNGVGNYESAWKGDLLRTIEFWDPMTGKVVHELPAIAVTGMVRFNRDGSKLLVHSGQFPKQYRYTFTVYDTHTWQGKDYDTNGVIIDRMAWTSQDKILVIGSSNPIDNSTLRLPNGQAVEHGSTVAKLMDIDDKQQQNTTILFPPHKPDAPGYLCKFLIPDYIHHRVVLIGDDGSLIILDANSMEKLKSIDPKTLETPSSGSLGRSISQDGLYLYILSREAKEQQAGFIIDLQTDVQVGRFAPQKAWGLSLNPNGKTLAIGRNNEVLLYDLK